MDSVRHGGTDPRTAAAHQEAAAFADALLALRPVDEHLHRELVQVGNELRRIRQGRLGEPALFDACLHLDALIQAVCTSGPGAAQQTVAEAAPAPEADQVAPPDGVRGDEGAPPQGGTQPRDGAGPGDEGGPRDGTPPRHGDEAVTATATATATAVDGTPAVDGTSEADGPRPVAALPAGGDQAGDARTDAGGEDAAFGGENTPAGGEAETDGGGEDAAAGGGEAETEAGGTAAGPRPWLTDAFARSLLEEAVRSRWASVTDGTGFRTELQNPAPDIAELRCAARDHRELARGLRLDALRLPPAAGHGLHRELARILGTEAPAEDVRLPGFGDVLEAVPLRTQPQPPAPSQLPELWAELARLVGADEGEGHAVHAPPYLETVKQQRAMCHIVLHALDLVAVARESLRVAHSGLVRENGSGPVAVLDAVAVRQWEASVRGWVVELGRIGARRDVTDRGAFVAKLVAFDETLAQVVPDPVPPKGSWWYDGRLRVQGQVNLLIGAEEATALGKFMDYQTKDIGAVADTRVLSAREPYKVLWWLRLPYDPPPGGAALGEAERRKGRVICAGRQAAGRPEGS